MRFGLIAYALIIKNVAIPFWLIALDIRLRMHGRFALGFVLRSKRVIE